MNLTQLAGVLASFAVVLTAVSTVVVAGLKLIIDSSLQRMRNELFKELGKYMPKEACASIRDEQCENLRVVVRDEIHKYFDTRPRPNGGTGRPQ